MQCQSHARGRVGEEGGVTVVAARPAGRKRLSITNNSRARSKGGPKGPGKQGNTLVRPSAWDPILVVAKFWPTGLCKLLVIDSRERPAYTLQSRVNPAR